MPTKCLALYVCSFVPFLGNAWSQIQVEVRADFPAGNAAVVKNEGDTVHLAPELRGGQPWFHWHFEAAARRPGAVKFVFAKPPMVGVRGPAISRDGGKSWSWLGAEANLPQLDGFSFAFTEVGQTVRFAVAIPYLQRDLDEFLDKHKDNPHLTRTVLTHTKVGRRPVDLLQVGKTGPGIRSVLATARHHACESTAGFVLEGLLREAMSESPAGVAFRRRYVLFAVPIVDKDGVESGDQGKNRAPHDHNRDYGDAPIYPEIQAIQKLAEQRDVRYSLDLHCPYLRGDIHEAFHFLGLGLPHVKDNLKEFIGWLKEERPPAAMVPLELLADPRKPDTLNRRINSHWFATRENSLFAATLEIPYALDQDLAREYGASLVKAWVRTEFVPETAQGKRAGDEQARLAALRTAFTKSYRSDPKAAEASLASLLGGQSAPVLRAEAGNLMAVLRLHQRKHPEALAFVETVEPEATTHQQTTAAALRVQIICADPKSAAGDVDAALARWQRHAYLASDQQAKVFEVVGEFHQRQGDLERALEFARKQFTAAPAYEKGKLLNRIAAIHELRKRPDEAVAARKEAVALLRARLGPVPQRSVFGAMMCVDLFEATVGIPTSSLEEKRTAAALVLNHDVVSAAAKEKVRRTMTEIEKKAMP